MRKIVIGNQKNKDEILRDALLNAQEWDTIELLSGEYFDEDSSPLFMIKKDITVVGKATGDDVVKLNCGLAISGKVTAIFRNITFETTKKPMGTMTAFDGAKCYYDNVHINHYDDENWITFYAQNSFISLKDSQVLYQEGSDNKTAILLQNSKIMADNSKISVLKLDHSEGYLTECKALMGITLVEEAKLHFSNLIIESNVDKYSELSVRNSSVVDGKGLVFTNHTPGIDVKESSVTLKDFTADIERIFWYADDYSVIDIDDDDSDINEFE